MKKAKGSHGGARPNSGRPAGGENTATIAKRETREAICAIVRKELEPIVKAQVLNAQGVSYMMLRQKDGSFTRATDVKQIDAACAAGSIAFQIFTQQPNQQSAAMLLGYAADKPIEPHEHSGEDGGPIKLSVSWKTSKK